MKQIVNLENIRFLSIGIMIFLFMITFGFLLFFAPVGLEEAEKQQPHAFDGHRYLNYHTFDFMMYVTPIVCLSIVVVLVLLLAFTPPFKKGTSIKK